MICNGRQPLDLKYFLMFKSWKHRKNLDMIYTVILHRNINQIHASMGYCSIICCWWYAEKMTLAICIHFISYVYKVLLTIRLENTCTIIIDAVALLNGVLVLLKIVNNWRTNTSKEWYMTINLAAKLSNRLLIHQNTTNKSDNQHQNSNVKG